MSPVFVSDEFSVLPEGQATGPVRLTAEIIDDVNLFAMLEADWDELAENSTATVFQTFDWQYLWWKHFATRPDCRLFIVLIREGERLVGLAPFYIQSYSVLGLSVFRRLKFLGGGLQSSQLTVLSLERDGPADYLDIVAATGFEEEVSRTLGEVLKEKSYLWDDMYFQNLPEGAILSSHLLPLLGESGCEISTSTTDACLKVELPETYEGYLAPLKKKVRQHFRHAYRAYFQNPEYSLEDVISTGSIGDSLEILSRLHQKRWNAVGYPGLFSDKRFTSLHSELAETLARKNRLWFKMLRKGGKPVVVELGYKFNDRIYPYTSGFDQERGTGSQNSSPGLAMKLLVIEEGISEGYQIVDLSRGGESYKYDLTSVVTHNSEVTARFSDGGSGARKTAFGVYKNLNSVYARVSCEIGIMKVLARQKGTPLVFSEYLESVKKRFSGESRSVISRLAAGKFKLFHRDNDGVNAEVKEKDTARTLEGKQEHSPA